MITFLLILHGLTSVVLLGGLTHQALAVLFPAKAGGGVMTSFRSVNAAVYTKANIVLYLVTFVLGALIYPAYRVAVRTWIERARLWEISGSFEMKEQFVAVGLGMLPLYWFVWRKPLDPALASTRAWITAILCAIVWFGFLVGHILNNVRGLFGQ